LLLTGVGPLFAWRRTSMESLKKNFLWPSIISLVFGAVLVAVGIRHFYAVVCFVLCAFVAITIFIEFFRGSRVIQSKQDLWLGAAMWELTHRNTRRYGGYIVHMAIVLMFIGFAGTAFTLDSQAELPVGDTLRLGAYEMRLQNIEQHPGANYDGETAVIDVSKNGKFLQTMRTERRFYHSSQQMTSEVAIRARMTEDVYLVFAGYSNDGQTPVIQAYINPLVNWIWAGGFLLVFGTLVALIPSKIKRIHPKMRIVGTVKKEHAVPAKS
jgi:cytochrome c-type biogenesis protein CcmF